MSSRYYAICLSLFAVLSVIINLGTLTSGGYHYYIDWIPRYDLDSFRADFLSIFKSGQYADLDFIKRVAIDWIFLVMDVEQFDRIRFAALTFMIFSISYAVFVKLIEHEKYAMDGWKRHAIAFAAAFFYMVNPLSIEHFVAFYPQVSYALFPAAFYFLYMSLEKNDVAHPILFGAVSSLLTWIVIHNALFLGVLAGCTAAAAVLCRRAALGRAFRAGAISLAVFALLSLHVIFMVAQYWGGEGAPNPGYINTMSYVEGVAEDAKMLNILLLDYKLFHWPLLWDFKYPFGGLYLVTMGLMVAAVLALGIMRRSWLSLSAALNFSVFALLSNGIHSPIGAGYAWLVFNLGYGWLLRASPKFTFLLPLLFSLLLMHSLAAASRDRRLLALAVCAIILHQGVFCSQIWTGDFGGSLVKHRANPDLVEVLEILKDDKAWEGRVAWFGDFAESSPREGVGKPNIARFIIDNNDPAFTLSQVSRALEIRYVLIDKQPGDPLVYLAYTKFTIPLLKESYEPVYEGKKFVLFDINDDVERFYLPKSVFLLYTGYDGLQAISRIVPLGRDIAPVLGDDEAGLAGELDGYADIVVFDSAYAPIIDLRGGSVISLAAGVPAGSASGWKKSRANDDSSREYFSRFVRARELEFDQRDYGRGIAYVSQPYEVTTIEGAEPEISFRNISFEEGDDSRLVKTQGGGIKAFAYRGSFADSCPVLLFNGSIGGQNVSKYWVEIVFLDAEGWYAGSSVIYNGSRGGAFNKTVFVPALARNYTLRMLARTGDGNFTVNRLDAIPMKIGYYSYRNPFEVPDDGEYELFVRVFRSPIGGRLGVTLDNQSEIELNTLSNVTGFEWVRVYGGPLSAGSKGIAFRSIGGYNAVNIAYLRSDSAPADDYFEGKGILYLYEGESQLDYSKSMEMHGGNFSDGLALGMGTSSTASSELHIYSNRTYYVRAEGKDISVEIDGLDVLADGIALGEGEHVVSIRPLSDSAYVDYVAIADAKAESILEMLGNGSMPSKGSVEYNRTGRTSYVVMANNSAPALLAFTAGHSKSFGAHYEGKTIRPIPLLSVANAFPLNETGARAIQVRYDPQDGFDLGLLLSSTCAAGITAYLVVRWKRG